MGVRKRMSEAVAIGIVLLLAGMAWLCYLFLTLTRIKPDSCN